MGGFGGEKRVKNTNIVLILTKIVMIVNKIEFYDEEEDKFYTVNEDFDNSLIVDLVDDEDLVEIK